MNTDYLLSTTLHLKASDLHLSENEYPKVRIDGELKTLPNTMILEHEAMQAFINQTMTNPQKKLFLKQHEIDYVYCDESQNRFRVNAFHQHRGLAAVIRPIPTTVPSFQNLLLPEQLQQFCHYENGLILITGCAGSGKSTTLAAMINHINQIFHKHIITIEDPIEFVHHNQNSLISQREVGRHTHNFHSALSAALREDPDIILIGEMRDLATIKLGLTAAETGHLVLATLHATSAAKTIDRIIDVFPGEDKNMIRSILSESLRAIVAQTLLQRAIGGRIGAYEILINTPAVRNLIRENKIAQIYSTIQLSQSVGMTTFEQYLTKLTEQQLI